MPAPPPLHDPHTGCLTWQGSTNSNGYGTSWSSGRPRLAHYEAWEAVRGPVPSNRQLEHWCRNRRCVQVAHLEPLSQGENLRRRSWAYRSKLTKCPKGHDLFLNGRRTSFGGVVCLVCSGLRAGSQSDPGVKRQSNS